MEKRWSERKALNVNVDIYQHGELLVAGHSANIGLGGAFLATDNATGLQVETDVDLVFCLQSQSQGTKHNIHARVTRLAVEGVGFKFCNFDTGVFRSLQEIMAHQQAANE
ncbi:MAG: PilZ domain-containing protein [Ectothiorhodospiraceae bacterium]|nr:PilZ domain-containing protein [Ectothiorhodospiraceae bacterium]